MKLELLADILKALGPILKAKTVFYALLVLTFAFWAGFLFPQVFGFFGLDNWRVQNDAVIGWGVISTSVLFAIAFLVNLDSWIAKWIAKKLEKGREERRTRDVFRNLSREELLYLYQYIQHNTTLIEFDERDPIVGLLNTKGLIYPSLLRVHMTSDNIRYNCRYDEGTPFEVSPLTHNYLVKHPELFSKLSRGCQ